jgi:hypothetical protein
LTSLAAFALVSGCSILDQIDFGPPKLDPNKVYLGTSRVHDLGRGEMDRYACVGGPLMCEQRGVGFDCRCL